MIPAAASKYQELREHLKPIGVDDQEQAFTVLGEAGEAIDVLDSDLAVMRRRTPIGVRFAEIVRRAEARMAVRAAEAKRGLS